VFLVLISRSTMDHGRWIVAMKITEPCMGLFMMAYTFPAGVPTTAYVANTLRAAMTEEVMLSGSLLRPPLTEEQIALLAGQKTSALLLSDAALKLTLTADRNLRRRRDASITVSLRGSDFVVTGTSRTLFRATCKALESLGGIARSPLRKIIPASGRG
jgi:hypothetical protein